MKALSALEAEQSPIDRSGRQGDMMDNSVEILFLSFLKEAVVRSSDVGKDVHSLTLFIKHFLCQSQHSPPPKGPWGMVLERLSWHMTCTNQAAFCLLTVARRGSCSPQGSWSCSSSSCWPCAQSRRCGEVSSGTWFWKPGSFSFWASMQDPCLTAIEEDEGRTSTCLQSWWCCCARSCLIWPLLPLPRQSWCGCLLSRCYPCTSLLPGTWN